MSYSDLSPADIGAAEGSAFDAQRAVLAPSGDQTGKPGYSSANPVGYFDSLSELASRGDCGHTIRSERKSQSGVNYINQIVHFTIILTNTSIST